MMEKKQMTVMAGVGGLSLIAALLLGGLSIASAQDGKPGQGATKYTCWINEKGQKTGEDTAHEAFATDRPGTLRWRQGTGDYAYGFAVAQFPCPKTIHLPNPAPGVNQTWTPAAKDIVW